MIRIACIAATLVTSALLPVQFASASVNLNGRIQLITSLLQSDARFSGSDYSFSLGSGGSQTLLFKGIEGVRGITNLKQINDWVLGHAATTPVYEGGTYQFTHSVLDNYFNTATPLSVSATPLPDPAPASTVFDGAPYQFTHSVLDSYFNTPSDTKVVAQSTLAEPLVQARVAPVLAPIPEPRTWIMMIGGFAIVGAAMRARRSFPRVA